MRKGNARIAGLKVNAAFSSNVQSQSDTMADNSGSQLHNKTTQTVLYFMWLSKKHSPLGVPSLE